MSEKQGPPPSHLAGHTVGYGLLPTAPQNPPPPSYLESLNHQVVAGTAGIPPQYQYMTQAQATQMQKMFQDKDAASLAYAQNLAAAHQAQKLAYSQQMAYQQQQSALYMQQQQQLYSQQLRGYYPQAGLQPGQNVMVLNGYDAGARFDGMAQASIPPPPPGAQPNAAQLAAAAGAQVSMSQKKGSFLSGGSGGGYTFW